MELIVISAGTGKKILAYYRRGGLCCWTDSGPLLFNVFYLKGYDIVSSHVVF